mgnify:CR=1 FL=1
MKNQLQLLTPSINLTASVAVTHQEAQLNIGARSLSWYHAAVRPGPVFAGELAAFAGDVARAVSDETVQAVIVALCPHMEPCDTQLVAELEVSRRLDELLEAVEESKGIAAPARAVVTTAALAVAAAMLRAKAVRW